MRCGGTIGFLSPSVSHITFLCLLLFEVMMAKVIVTRNSLFLSLSLFLFLSLALSSFRFESILCWSYSERSLRRGSLVGVVRIVGGGRGWSSISSWLHPPSHPQHPLQYYIDSSQIAFCGRCINRAGKGLPDTGDLFLYSSVTYFLQEGEQTPLSFSNWRAGRALSSSRLNSISSTSSPLPRNGNPWLVSSLSLDIGAQEDDMGPIPFLGQGDCVLWHAHHGWGEGTSRCPLPHTWPNSFTSNPLKP